MPVVDPVAVADPTPVLSAVSPDRMLDKPGKIRRKGAVKLPGIDPIRDHPNDVGAVPGPIANDEKRPHLDRHRPGHI